MISLDLETSGINPANSSILSIGAVDIFSEKEFYIETRAYSNREIDTKALAVNGFTIEQATDKNKPLPHEGYLALIKWIKENNLNPLLIGQNIGSFDVQFLLNIHDGYSALYPDVYGKWVFGHRYIDLHTLAYAKFNKSLKMDEVLKELGLPPEPRPHNALTGAKTAKTIFKKIMETK